MRAREPGRRRRARGTGGGRRVCESARAPLAACAFAWVYAPIRSYYSMILLGILLEIVWSYWNAPGAVPEDAPGTPTHGPTNGSQGLG
jgi:hypothetical protein